MWPVPDTFKIKKKQKKHVRNKHTDLQEPEELQGSEANQSFDTSVSSEERWSTFLSLSNFNGSADSQIKTEIEEANT